MARKTSVAAATFSKSVLFFTELGALRMKISYLGAVLLIACASVALATAPPATDKEKEKKEETAKKALAGKDQAAKVETLRSIAFGDLGDKKFIELILPHLGDKSAASGPQVRKQSDDNVVRIEVRDIALAALLKLTNQEPAGYGLIVETPNIPNLPNPPRVILFPTESHRKKAFENWEKWAKENLKETKEEKKSSE